MLFKTGWSQSHAVYVDTEMGYNTREEMAKIMMMLPHIKADIDALTQEEKQRLEDLIKQNFKEKCPTEPGVMKGVTIVGVAQKQG